MANEMQYWRPLETVIYYRVKMLRASREVAGATCLTASPHYGTWGSGKYALYCRVTQINSNSCELCCLATWSNYFFKPTLDSL